MEEKDIWKIQYIEKIDKKGKRKMEKIITKCAQNVHKMSTYSNLIKHYLF